MPTMPTIPVILFDASSGANAVLDTGPLDTADFESLLVIALSSGGNFTTSHGVSCETYDAGGTALVVYDAGVAAGNRSSFAWGPGCRGGWNLDTGIAGLDMLVPHKVRLQLPALGVGVTGRLIVIGRKVFRGIGM